jgi:hypothetical protein
VRRGGRLPGDLSFLLRYFVSNRVTPQETLNLATTVGNLAPRGVKVAARVRYGLVDRPGVSPPRWR